MLLSNTLTGEAPQLSCTNPAATATCVGTAGAAGYGYWDDGSNVFNSLYDNFSGKSLRTSLWANSVTGTLSVANGITLSKNSFENHALIISQTLLPTPFIGEFYAPTMSTNNPYVRAIWGIGPSQTSFKTGAANPTGYDNSYAALMASDAGDAGFTLLEYGTSTMNTITIYGTNVLAPGLLNISWYSTGGQYLSTPTNQIRESIAGTNSMLTLSSGENFYFGVTESGTSTSSGSLTAYWARTRDYPPSGVQPTITFGTPTYTLYRCYSFRRYMEHLESGGYGEYRQYHSNPCYRKLHCQLWRWQYYKLHFSH